MKKESPIPADADLSHLLPYWLGPGKAECGHCGEAGGSAHPPAQCLSDVSNLSVQDLERLIRAESENGRDQN